MRKIIFLFLAAGLMLTAGCAPKPEMTLKEALAGQFLIGTALNISQITGRDTLGVEIIAREFNTIVAENCMKSGELVREPGQYDFTMADRFVEFGEANGMFVTGHTLVWHSQLPRWFTRDEEGNDVSREVLIERMREHINTVAGRYKGRVKGWDVINETFEDDGALRRNSPFVRIIGEDFIPLAFQFAHEADPDAELYYNDYSMFLPGRRDAVVKMIRDLKAKGIRIDAIGMQGHYGMDYPELAEVEKSIEAFAAEGVKVMITEFDVSALPTAQMSANVGDQQAYMASLNPYVDGIPADADAAWNARMEDFFGLFLKHADKITRVTMWGVTDGDSWKNGFPIRGRTDYPLLYYRDYQPKPIVGWLKSQAWKTPEQK